MPTTKTRMRTGSSDSAQSSGSPAPARPDCPLFMECEEEELSEAQMNFYTKKKNAFTETMKKLEDLAKAGAKITANNDNSVTFRVTETTTTMGPVNTQSQAATGNQQYRFLMDPKTGRIIGSIPSQGGVGGPVLPSPPTMVRAPTATPPSRTMTPRGRGGVRQPIRPSIRGTPSQPVRGRTPPAAARETTPSKSSPQVVDLTKPGVEPVGAQPIRKAFPALSVSAKPQRTVPAASAKRSELDAKVKGLLVHTPAKFTEWLIQQGLVRSEQYETVPGTGKVKLKLGMYSDGKKFPHSGGYVWIQEGVSNKYTSVYKGSIFETSATSHPPTVLLKMIYHWSCQTNIPNVAQWVKVDNKQIDEFFQVLRSVCVGAVQDEVISLGGPGKVVEIGVISLGTTTADGQKREVRVEVLGVLDRSTRNLRLRATEPIQGASQGERFGKIFEPLPTWVHRGSRIVTDYSVDRETLVKLGYKSVVQCSLSQATGQRPENTNQQMMDYLKKVVPKMFQNTLSNLTTAVIQQFLDELTFRELFGQTPLACFEGLIQRVSGQTTATALTEDTMAARLARVAADPFQDWRAVPVVTEKAARSSPGRPPSTSSSSSSKRPSAEPEVGDTIDDSVTKRLKVAKELVELESYYYGCLPGEDAVVAAEFKADMAFKCHVCKKLYMNNLEFMKHLHLHVETDRETAIDMADLSQCKYCYKDFDSEAKVQEHLEAQHLKTALKHVCRICEESFGISTHLIHHMQKVHVRSELPYLCHICSFRSSQHRDVVEHFQNTHDRTDKLQCPLCLKTTGLYGEKGYNADTAVKFMQHLQKHEDTKNKSGLNCRKCNLKFVDEKSVKNHTEQDHQSYRDFEDVEPAEVEQPGLQMPPPDERGVRTATRKSTLARSLPQQAAFASQNLEDLAIYDAAGDTCCECNKSMTLAGHYVAYLCCTKCRYSSCCAKAMSLHVSIFHSPTSAVPVYDLGKPLALDQEMFCCCGFAATSGNKLAKHLASHGCRSAYPSKEEADKARVEMEQDTSLAEQSRTGEDEQEMEEEEKDEQQKLEEEEAFKKQCKTSPRKKIKLTKKSPAKKAAAEAAAKEDEEKETDTKEDDAEDNDAKDDEIEEDSNSPKPGGMLLFGTLFKYMGDKKEGEEEAPKTAEKAKDTTEKEAESKESGEEKGEEDKKAEDEAPEGEKAPEELSTPPPPQEEMDTA